MGRGAGGGRAARAVFSVRASRSVSRRRRGARRSGHAYYCYCDPEEIKAKREAAEAAGGALDVRPHLPEAHRRRNRARARPTAQPRAIRFFVPEGRDDVPRSRARADHRAACHHRGLRRPALRRLSDLPPVGGRRRCRDGDHARRPRRRPHLEHAEAGAALPRDGGAGAGVRARAAHPRAGQEAAEQASWRDVRRRVREAGLSAGGDGQLPRAARLVAGRRSGGVHARRADRRASTSRASAAATPCSTPRSWTGSISSTSHERRPKICWSGCARTSRPPVSPHPCSALETACASCARWI